jgi:hypothetical protein
MSSMDNNLIKEKYYVDKTDSDRNEIRIRSNNVCDEQVSSEPTKEDKEINMQKLLESLSDCV